MALCGHATLASAQVLWETGRLGASATARFHTKSGLLTAERRDAGIELDFPAYQASVRDGVVKVQVAGDRVRLGGQAVTVLRGELV